MRHHFAAVAWENKAFPFSYAAVAFMNEAPQAYYAELSESRDVFQGRNPVEK